MDSAARQSAIRTRITVLRLGGLKAGDRYADPEDSSSWGTHGRFTAFKSPAVREEYGAGLKD